MTDAVAQILSRIEGLSQPERAELAYALVCSLDSEDEQVVAAAWDVELVRRVAEIRSGQAIGIPAKEVFQRLKHS